MYRAATCIATRSTSSADLTSQPQGRPLLLRPCLAPLSLRREGSPILSVLDVDVQPSVAVEEALLGSLNEVTESVMLADVLKPAKHAAQELLALLDPSVRTEAFNMSMEDLAARLRDLTGSQLVALTSGGDGCTMATESTVFTVASCPLDKVCTRVHLRAPYHGMTTLQRAVHSHAHSGPRMSCTMGCSVCAPPPALPGSWGQASSDCRWSLSLSWFVSCLHCLCRCVWARRSPMQLVRAMLSWVASSQVRPTHLCLPTCSNI